MKGLILCFLVLICGIGLRAQETITVGGLTGKSYFIESGNTKIYYEIFGTGAPLLVLHGNGGSSKSVHSLLNELVKEYQVIAMDSRCHGQSGCPEGELNYTSMAEDTNTLMNHLGLTNYTIWGHSDGGIIGLILGYEHPERIGKMLLSGANARPDSSALEGKLVEFVQRYDEIKDPLTRKQIKLMAFHPNIATEDLKRIKVPVMLMVGDRDAIKIEHTVELFRAIPQSNLCVLPGTTHFIENPNHLLYWLKELKKPFATPSTIEIAEQFAKQLFGTK